MKVDLRTLFPKSRDHDDRTVNALLTSLKTAFNNQFDYLNFKQAVKSMESMQLDEATQYKSAFATASTLGITKQILIDSAKKYLQALENERSSFAEALKNQLHRKVDGKKEELNKIKQRILENERKIEELKKENLVLQEAIDNADDHVAAAKLKIENTKTSFLGAFDSIYNDIKNDVNSITNHL